MRPALTAFRKEAREIGPRRLFFLGSLTAGHVVVHWYTQLLPLVLPSLKMKHHLSNIQVGTITTALMGAGSAVALPSGYLADFYPRRRAIILTAAIVAYGLAYLLMGAAPSYIWLLLAAALLGLGSALWHPCALGALSLRFPERRGMALAIHGVGASVGDTLAPVIVGAIISVFPWEPVLQVHVIPALVVGLLLLRGLGFLGDGAGARPQWRSYASGIRDMLASRQVLAVMASQALTSMARLSVLTFLPIYIREHLKASDLELGVYLMLLYVMGVVSQPVMGVLSDRLGRKAILVPSFATMGLLYLAMGFAERGIQLGLVIGALGIFFYAILNVAQTAVMDVAEARVQASTMGVMGLFTQPASLFTPILVGYLVTVFGIKTAFWYASAAALMASAVLVPVRFRRSLGAAPGQ
ncbi:MAG: MFS transporter [Chloroflexi bacterium]|nr:MFS transporter [Chloroflexota bacterium]